MHSVDDQGDDCWHHFESYLVKMIFGHIKIALRNFYRNPLYAFLNVAGLSIGMTLIVLLGLYIKNELGFDSFHEKGSALYRVTTSITDKNGMTNTIGATGQPEGPAFKQSIPEIIDYARFWNVGGFNIAGNEKAFWLQGLFADSSFFRLLSFPALYGNTQSALTDPHSIVITESTAMRYFGRKNVVGETLKLEENGFQALTVKAVTKDVPANSSIRFDAIISFRFMETFFKDQVWFNPYLSTFVLLHPNADPRIVEQKLNSVAGIKASDQLQEMKRSERFSKVNFGLQAISDIHLNTATVKSEKDIWNSNTYLNLYLLSGIAIFILVMACINFINLTIAYSIKRTKEIGIRKINGGSRWHILRQFLIEASLLCAITLILSLLFSNALLPLFNSLTGRQITLNISNTADIWLALTGLLIICTLLAGFYPAYVLSNLKTVNVLYDKLKFRTTGLLGKSLVVLQFTLAIGFIAGTIVYYLQMNFITKADLGYNPSSVIIVNLPPQRNPDQLVKLFKNELVNNPSIRQVAGSNSWGEANPVLVNGKEIQSLKLRADESYIPTLEIPIVEGRNFSAGYITDSVQSVIVNESFVQAAGLKTPVGQRVQLSDEWEGNMSMNIVGVMKDYHYFSFKKKVGPQILVMKHYEKLFVKTADGKIPQALAGVEKVYKKYIDNSPFQFSLLADNIESQYEQEHYWQRIVTFASIISIIICCLGLFGLSGISAHQRLREIGIRKVLGASVTSIAALLSRDFLKPVLIAILIATPACWMLMYKWLENFAYRISIGWWMFAIAGIIGIVIALATVSYQTFKAALGNPVKALQSE